MPTSFTAIYVMILQGLPYQSYFFVRW